MINVEKWTAAKVDEGWEHDEKVFAGPPKQEKKWNRHVCEKAKSKGKHVPPLNANVSLEDFSPGMHREKFLRTWANKQTYQAILTTECRTEVEYLERRKEDKQESLYFNSSYMKWHSWSAMLMIEYCYDMCDCTGFTTCLGQLVTQTLDKYTKHHQQKCRDKGVIKLQKLLLHLNKIQQALYPPATAALRPLSAINFKEKIVETIVRSKWWKKSFPNKKDSSIAKQFYLVAGSFQKPDIAVIKAKDKGEKNLFDRLVNPDVIHEITFLKGVASLLKLVFGEDMDVHKKITIANNDHCAAVLCLIQLLCGSRSRGVICVNWFDKVIETPEEKIRESVNEKDFDDRTRLGTIRTRFGGLDYCIQVHRITKERDEEVKQYQEQTKEIIREGKEVTDVKSIGEVVSKKKVIVKPILFMYLSRKFLDSMYEKDTLVTPKDGVSIFLHLVTVTRKWIFDRQHELKSVTSPLNTKMEGLTDKDALDSKNPDVIRMTGYWNSNMNKILKNSDGPPIFPKEFLTAGRGTHMLRRLYVNRGYFHFSSASLKETAFTRLTLGHKSFNVSLYYTSLIVEPSVHTSMSESNVIHAFETKVADLDRRVEALEESKNFPQTRVLTTNEIPFETKFDDIVYIKKLTRAPRNTEMRDHIARAVLKWNELIEKDVKPTVTKILRLGILRHKEVFKALSEQ